jgi:hypothetical protein
MDYLRKLTIYLSICGLSVEITTGALTSVGDAQQYAIIPRSEILKSQGEVPRWQLA